METGSRTRTGPSTARTAHSTHDRSESGGWSANQDATNWWAVILGAVNLVLGLLIGAGGVWLIALGGSWYYGLAGLGLIVSGALLIRQRPAGAWLYVLIWALTVIWAYWEVGLDGWALMPRLLAPTIILILVLTALPGLLQRRSRTRSSGYAAIISAALIPAMTLLYAMPAGPALAQSEVQTDTPDTGEVEPAPQAPDTAEETQPDDGLDRPALQQGDAVPAIALEAGQDWPAYGGTHEGRRFSLLSQINRENVAELKKVWEYRTGDLPSEEADGRYSPENTPLKVGDSLFLCSPKNILISLDAKTGKEEWRYDPEVSDDAIPYGATCRGAAYFAVPDAAPEQLCSARVMTATLDARLIAVDARTGQLCPDFGREGMVDLNRGIGDTVPGWYAVTTPPTIVRGIAVVGAQVKDGQAEDAPSGVVRGYDAVTGELAWAWDLGNPDQKGLPPEGETYTRGTPNMWTIAAGDEELGLVYLPMGNSSVDYWGGNRSEAENTYSTALVALDVSSGEVAWSFQTIHYDVWDYDLGSQPSLVDFPADNGTIPALVLPTKQGQIYVLDRRSGESLFPLEERPVPSGGVEPENLSKTQPYSAYAAVNQPPLTEKDMWGMSPLDQLWCRIQFRQANYEGEYTPPSADRPWIQYPGYNGGSDWGSAAVDPDRGILVVNYNDMPNFNQLIPREKADELGLRPIDEGGTPKSAEGSGDPQAGAPYAIRVNAGWRLPTGLLCKKPPYGGIRAIDLKTGETLWDRPLGTARNNGPFGIPSMLPWRIGTPNNGGPLTTAGGLIFIAATTDDLFRAIDIETGETLWEVELPAGGQTTPMTYEADGQQFVVIAPGGHHFMETRIGDYVIAYALPDGN